MFRTVSIVATILAIAFATTGTAEADDSRWTKDDWLYAPLSGAGAGAAGAIGAGLIGYQIDGHCIDSTEDCVPAFFAAGMGTGLILGSAYGVTLYGKRRGFDGSLKGAVIGSLLGNLASGSVIALTAKTVDNGTIGFPIVIAALVGMPALGATIGYKRTMGDESDPQQPISGALIDVNDGKVKLSPPAVSIGITKDSNLSLYLPVAGGRF